MKTILIGLLQFAIQLTPTEKTIMFDGNTKMYENIIQMEMMTMIIKFQLHTACPTFTIKFIIFVCHIPLFRDIHILSILALIILLLLLLLLLLASCVGRMKKT